MLFLAVPDLFGAGSMALNPPPILAFFVGGPSSRSSFLGFGRLTIIFFGPLSSPVFFRVPFGFGGSTEGLLGLRGEGGVGFFCCSDSDSLSE